MQVLTVDQLRAVLAHEFGHYHGGDTALGPWIYRTREAMERTLAGLRGHSSVLAAPFRAYGELFMRITQAVSRRAEYAADALAARVVGARPMMEGLKAMEGAAAVFGAYWQNEYVPALEAGMRPPFAAGFRSFAAVDTMAAASRDAVERELREGRSNPHDSHPSLRERIDALQRLTADPPRPGDDAPALSLLDGIDALEAATIDAVIKPEARSRITPGTWDEAVERVWLPMWRSTHERIGSRLKGRTPASLAEFAGRGNELPVAMCFVARADIVQPGDVSRCMQMAGAALVLALHAHGWTVRADPGQEVRAERDGMAIRPFHDVRRLLAGEYPADEWRATWAATGIGDVDLATAAAPALATAGEG
jgi:hypothetical protein